MAKERIILGIDPGTLIMGYGVISCNKNASVLISSGIVNLHKFTSHADKLRHIFKRTTAIIEQYKPDELAVEAPFYGKNAQSMLKLGRAQGVAFAAALERDIPVYEYSPKKIKQSITGNGNASKHQVALMLQKLFQFEEMPKFLDATDGLAVALCHSFQMLPMGMDDKKYGSWKAYVAANSK